MTTTPSAHQFSWLTKLALGGVLVLLLAAGFWGYLSPGMRLNWETVASLCGF